MIKVSLDCNALTYDEIDKELVKWLKRDCSDIIGSPQLTLPNPRLLTFAPNIHSEELLNYYQQGSIRR